MQPGIPHPASLLQESLPHTVNVVCHVAFGTLALALGLVALLAKKGGAVHVRFGRYFLGCLTVVLSTAVIGLLAFGFRAFLSVITLLAAYEGYSGYRAVARRSRGPQVRDHVLAIACLASAGLFLLFLRSVHLPWAPVVIYSTLGTVVTVASYDLARLAFPKRWFARTWIYEHLIKMTGAYSAVVSAFAGTVLHRWQPYSQILPSALGTLALIGFGIFVARRGGARAFERQRSSPDGQVDPLPTSA